MSTPSSTNRTFSSPADFGRTVPLPGLVTQNEAVKDLYGTTEWVVDTAALSKRFQEAGFTAGLEIAVAEIESRLVFLNEPSR